MLFLYKQQPFRKAFIRVVLAFNKEGNLQNNSSKRPVIEEGCIQEHGHIPEKI